MIWRSFSTVVYPLGRSAASASCTSRTVLGPRRQSTERLSDSDRVLKEEVDRPLDHRHLNKEIPEFATTPPTAENLARWIWRRVAERITREGWPCRLASLTLTVTPTFSVEMVADDLPSAL